VYFYVNAFTFSPRGKLLNDDSQNISIGDKIFLIFNRFLSIFAMNFPENPKMFFPFREN